jgi:hypothetical protein
MVWIQNIRQLELPGFRRITSTLFNDLRRECWFEVGRFLDDWDEGCRVYCKRKRSICLDGWIRLKTGSHSHCVSSDCCSVWRVYFDETRSRVEVEFCGSECCRCRNIHASNWNLSSAAKICPSSISMILADWVLEVLNLLGYVKWSAAWRWLYKDRRFHICDARGNTQNSVQTRVIHCKNKRSGSIQICVVSHLTHNSHCVSSHFLSIVWC